MDRISEDEIFMESARLWAQRSQCSRLHVGSVLVKDSHIISSGWNGAPRGIAECIHINDTPCRVSVHSESNALVHAAKTTTSVVGATMYVTHAPCLSCAGLIINAEVSSVIYDLDFRSMDGVDLLRQANILVRKFSDIHTQ